MPTEKLLWSYQGKAIRRIEDIPDHENIYGFVYMITNERTGKYYIGKKILRNTRKKKISQRVKKTTGSRKTYERKITESNWKEYYGSSLELSKDVQKLGKKHFTRQILELCCTKKYLSYAEVRWQILSDVLRNNSYNGNILGRYYARDMDNCKPLNDDHK